LLAKRERLLGRFLGLVLGVVRLDLRAVAAVEGIEPRSATGKNRVLPSSAS